jgi:hypothetical protein
MYTSIRGKRRSGNQIDNSSNMSFNNRWWFFYVRCDFVTWWNATFKYWTDIHLKYTLEQFSLMALNIYIYGCINYYCSCFLVLLGCLDVQYFNIALILNTEATLNQNFLIFILCLVLLKTYCWCYHFDLLIFPISKVYILLRVKEWLLFNPNEQYLSYIVSRTSYMAWWCLLCTRLIYLMPFL